MADLGGLLSVVGSGGVAGIFGQLINRSFAVWEAKERRKDAQLANQHEEKRWGNEKELLQIQMQQATEANEQDISLAAATGSWDGLKASLVAEAAVPPSYPWVNAVRALVRPVLTFGSQIALLLVFFTATATVKATIQQQIVEGILFIATASALWWFGERAQSKGKK